MEIHDKKQLAAICIERLKKEYPLSDCTLDYEHAWQLLVEVRLAAQCTDARVNVVVQDLFAKYPNVAALAARSLQFPPALRTGAQQGAGYQRLYADAARQV